MIFLWGEEDGRRQRSWTAVAAVAQCVDLVVGAGGRGLLYLAHAHVRRRTQLLPPRLGRLLPRRRLPHAAGADGRNACRAGREMGVGVAQRRP